MLNVNRKQAKYQYHITIKSWVWGWRGAQLKNLEQKRESSRSCALGDKKEITYNEGAKIWERKCFNHNNFSIESNIDINLQLDQKLLNI